MRAELHTHSTFSDGELIPAELIRRAEYMGVDAIAITDHVDTTNVEFVVSNIVKATEMYRGTIQIIPGAEITHVPPSKMDGVIAKAKKLGAQWIVVHGETSAEPVMQGTNFKAASNPDVNVLAHPGFLSIDDAEFAKKNGVLIEITSRNGHNVTNGHVAIVAKKVGAKMIVNSDAHAPEDLLEENAAYVVALGAGLTQDEAKKAIEKTPFQAIKNL